MRTLLPADRMNLKYLTQCIIRLPHTVWLIGKSAITRAQPYIFDDILFGVAYCHEYMPYEAGIKYVRLGESTWHYGKPREGI
jgi:beta-galactosidase